MTVLPLVVEGARIRYEPERPAAPDGVDLRMAPGEVVLLLGPSGSGKSTLALALKGFIPHVVPATLDGRILVAGIDTLDSSPAELSDRIGMVFQDPDAQIVTGTVLDEVCFGPENLCLPTEEILARAERALTAVGLWTRRAESPDRLSGGGRQRLAIACALALDPAVLVLDEPTANLDPAGTEDVYALLGQLVGRGDRSILLIEHDLDAAIGIVDRVVVLDRDGRVALDGTVDEVVRGRADEIERLGVWLPVATIAARELRHAGVELRPVPITPSELAVALDAQPTLPDPVPHRAGTAHGTAPAVTVRSLTLVRQGRPVVRDVDLEVPAGAFLAILGVNGAGKTSLLQAIAGVVPPPRRQIAVHGLDPATADARTLARTVGFVFQNPEHQFIKDSVAEELAHGLRLQGRPEAEIQQRVEAMLERFGLSEHREVHPFLLSGGQKRRLSVGTAIIAGPPVLALDEPSYGQDRERAGEMLDLLAGLHAGGTTILVVTHDLQLAAEHATHLAVMADGTLLGMGETAETLQGDLIERAGLRLPPLAQATRALVRHPTWHAITRLAELPGRS